MPDATVTTPATVESSIKVVAKKGDGFPFRRYERPANLTHDQARRLIDFFEKLVAEPAAK